MKIALTMGFSLALMVVLGCQSTPKYSWTSKDLIVDEKTFLKAPEGTLSKEDIDKDKSFLIYALTNGYGGRKYIPDNKLQFAIEAINKILGPMAVENFRDKVDEALLIIPDNHLVARVNGSASKARQKSYKKGMVGENAISEKDKIWEVKQKKHRGKTYLYVSITHFPSHKDKLWNDFIPQVKKKMKGTSFAIIDLRGNGGGDDTMGFSLAELLNGKPVRNPMTKQYISQTAETLAIFMNNFKLREIKIKNQGKKAPDYYEELRAEKEKEYKQAIAGKLPPEKTEGNKVEQVTAITQASTKNSKGYGKPIRIVFDGDCGSSCESTIDAFEFVPNLKKIGQNTAGFIHFGNIGFVVLPVSKIEIQTPTHYNEFYDGRFVERIGLKPDIYVPNNKNALNYAFESLTR